MLIVSVLEYVNKVKESLKEDYKQVTAQRARIEALLDATDKILQVMQTIADNSDTKRQEENALDAHLAIEEREEQLDDL
jgi:uncharacterized protein YoxC